MSQPTPDAEARAKLIAELRAEFESLVDRRGADECWPWRGKTIRGERGTFRGHIAPRLAWEMAHGSHPGKLFVCHSCDNPNCVNPAHLWLGTNSDNIKDAVRKGRVTIRCKFISATACQKGHPYTPENTRVTANGYRHCRTCQREMDRAYKNSHRLRREGSHDKSKHSCRLCGKSFARSTSLGCHLRWHVLRGEIQPIEPRSARRAGRGQSKGAVA